MLFTLEETEDKEIIQLLLKTIPVVEEVVLVQTETDYLVKMVLILELVKEELEIMV